MTKLYDFLESTFHIDLTDSKVTLNNCKNTFDPKLNAMRLEKGLLSDMEYSNTVAWTGHRGQLFKVGTYIVQLIQEDRGSDRFILASVAKVLSCVENPNYDKNLKIEYVAGKPTIDVTKMVKIPYSEGGNVPTTKYTYKLERIDIGDFRGLRVILNFRRSEAYQINFDAKKDDIVLEPALDRWLYKFPGFSSINHSFATMATLIDHPDWKTSLEHQKGIYMLIDTNTGKQYVGSAYGKQSLWQRWKCYLNTGHGGDKALIPLGKQYIMDNFKMIVLERCGDDMSTDEIIQHESLWKEKFETRKFGYNEN